MWGEKQHEAVDEAQYSAHLARLSLSNTISFLDVFRVDRVRSTVHNRVHKADLQPETGRSPNHVAVDEIVIQLDDDQYWLYAAVDPQSNDLLHTKLETTRNNVIADQFFFTELREKHDVDDAIFLVDGAVPLHRACEKHGLDFRYERHGNRNSVERIFCEVKRRTIISQTVLATPKQKQQTNGLYCSPSHRISLSEHLQRFNAAFMNETTYLYIVGYAIVLILDLTH